MASKSKRRRKVLGASCILAALIIAGSSFAWFTSKDEVTNRLTATADYGVSLVEDFKPPEDMTPGQEVNKDVSVVNTGAIDAFVRASLSESMNMSRLSSVEYITNALTDTAQYYTVYKKTDGTVVKKLANVAKADDETKLYDLKNFSAALPALATVTTVEDEYVALNPQENQDATGALNANEVTTLMAGGQLVVAESKAVAPEDMAVRSGDDVNGATKLNIIYKLSCDSSNPLNNTLVVKEGSDFYPVSKNPDGLYVKGTKIDPMPTAYTLAVQTLARDYSGASQYKPTGDGLYIFKRNDTPEYSGFYYNSGAFYALKTKENNKSAYIDFGTGGISYDTGNLVVDSITGVELRTKETGIDNTKGTWKLEFVKTVVNNPSTNSTTSVAATESGYTDATHLKATFHVTTDQTAGTPVTTKDVIFYVKLADGWSNKWQYVADKSTDTDKKDGVTTNNGLGYFYYKTLLDSGVTSASLIDSVTLASQMGSENYLDMVYDLNVALDSAQVTKDQYGNETAEAVEATASNGNTTTWATPALTKNAASAAGGDDVDGTIDSIAWS